MALSTYIGNAILNKILKNTDFTTVTTVYVSLHTADPGLTGTSEVTGGSYARQTAAFNTVASKASDNSAAIEFAGMPAATVTYIGLWDNVSGGNFLWGGSNTGTQSVSAGNTFRLAAGVLDVSLT